MKFQTLLHFSDDVTPLELGKLPSVLEKMANDEGIQKGRISVALLTDDEIRVVNRDYLQHDYETDVISFDLSDDEDFLDGELVISVDTAKRLALDAGWQTEDEVLLYAIHGMLHILGYDDDTEEHRDEMRRLEAQYLKEFDVQGWEKHPTHGEAHAQGNRDTDKDV